jgi:uncharacterized membrane protein
MVSTFRDDRHRHGGAGQLGREHERQPEAIGQAYTPAGTRHGFMWTRKTARSTGTPGGDSSYATAVNDHGWWLAAAGRREPDMARVRVVTSSGMEAPDAPGGGRSQANAINDNFIVGSSCDAGGVACHATLWKPPSRSSRD